VGGAAFDDSRYDVTSVRGEKLLTLRLNSINVTDPTTQRVKTTTTRKRVVSLLGDISVSYNDLIYLSVKGRNDWSSTMPIQNRSFFYPAADLSFVFYDLPSFQKGPLSFGKLMLSYAEVGKDAPSHQVRSSFAARTTTGGGFSYGFFGGNPTLKPERTRSYEIGTELKFLENRIGLEVSAYKMDRVDQIVSQRVSYGTGFVLSLINGWDFTTKGIEIALNGTPYTSQNFEWNVIVNYTKLDTKVKSLLGGINQYYHSDTWAYGNARAGAFVPDLERYYPTTNLDYNQDGAGSATAIAGYSYLRNNAGDILISPTTGLPIVNTNFLPIGDRNPDFTIGLTNQFSYKALTLSFLLDIRKGGDVWNGNEMYLFRNGLSMQMLDRETPRIIKGVLRDGNENTETPTQNTIEVTPYILGSTFYNSIPESEFVEHGINWLRLRDVTLNYTLPAALLGKQNVLKSASVFITGTDLFLMTNYTGADPSVNSTTLATGGAAGVGMDFGTLSMPRTFTGGVRLGF
jgi:hypothetical protein